VTPPEQLKVWRKGADLSQKGAAEKVGATAPAWCDWELDKKIPDLERAERLQRLTGIPVSAWSALARAKREARDAKKHKARRSRAAIG
jgi:transcriptional regulator with XRE-family HTH domain